MSLYWLCFPIILLLLSLLVFHKSDGKVKKYAGYCVIASSIPIPLPITPPLTLYILSKSHK